MHCFSRGVQTLLRPGLYRQPNGHVYVVVHSAVAMSVDRNVGFVSQVEDPQSIVRESLVCGSLCLFCRCCRENWSLPADVVFAKWGETLSL